MIGIINYGLGNIHAFANIYKRLNIAAVIVSTPEQLQSADRIILPGVGAFDWAMTRLDQSGLRDSLERMVLERKVPVLGVCVGMQMMANRSDEGVLTGLGWIDADVKWFGGVPAAARMQLPQMGWNDVLPQQNDPLLAGLEPQGRFYFLHSYYFLPKDQGCVIAATDYHGVYASAVRSENVFGVQFHPEKSHQWGIQLLKNFAEC